MLTRAAVKALRKRGIRLIHYLDDFGFAEQGFENATKLVVEVVAFLENLGFVINFGKSVTTPTQLMKFLGFLIDTVNKKFFVPPARREKLFAALHELVASANTRARVLFGLGGQLVSMRLGLGQAAVLYSREFYKGFHLSGHDAFDRVVRTSRAWKNCARWWLREFDTRNGVNIWDYSPVKAIYVWSDASGTGWGGHIKDFGNLRAAGLLPPEYLGTSSALRELYGIWMVLQSFVECLANSRARVRTDSQAVYFICKKGASMKSGINSLLERIFHWCALHNVNLWFEWVRRDFNTVADELSNFKDKADWKLLPEWFNFLQQRWGPFDVDRFASHLNNQLPTFNSKFWCPGTSGVDCFTLDWGTVNNWVNADYSMMHKVVLHMRYCKARGCLIVPYWPSRPWWHLLFPTGNFGSRSDWGDGVVDVFVFPRQAPLFAEAYGGSKHRAPPPKFLALAVYVDYSRV
jgi:hypothetical protein